MDYSKLSDQQINAAVAKIFPDRFLFNDEGNPYSLEPDCAASYTGSDFDEVEFDPCNNPADAWPIIIANKIDIIQDNGQGCALATTSAIQMFQGEDVHIEQDENPLRAGMVVFLMMQGE